MHFFEAIKELDNLDIEVVIAGKIYPKFIKWVENNKLTKKNNLSRLSRTRQGYSIAKKGQMPCSFLGGSMDIRFLEKRLSTLVRDVLYWLLSTMTRILRLI